MMRNSGPMRWRTAALAVGLLILAIVQDIGGVRAASPLVDAAAVAGQIAAGHAYDKHVVAEGQFPGIASRAAFAALIRGIIEHPTASRRLTSERTAWWDEASGTVVIANPHDRDGGTCFKPRAGRPYFDHLH
jgi:filamentous hemagglutinin